METGKKKLADYILVGRDKSVAITSNGEIDHKEKGTSSSAPASSSSTASPMDIDDPLKESTVIMDTVDPLKESTIKGKGPSSSGSSDHEDDDDYDDDDEYGEDVEWLSDEYYDYMADDSDDYLVTQSQFDKVDLPTGVEAAIPWLNLPSVNTAGSSSSHSPAVNDKSGTNEKTKLVDSALTENGKLVDSALTENGSKSAAKSSISTAQSLSTIKDKGNQAVLSFKQFDIVDDFPDHHYIAESAKGRLQNSWAKRIQSDWQMLEEGLPDTIFVRACEARMDLLRAVIIGPSGTPYHDGLFVFDCHFPSKYPSGPPKVYYYSGGLRLNPNLYKCGKVCLSLLGTWSGSAEEMWIPGKSTMLQVLVSIQALILNTNPFFNEPGYDTSYPGDLGEKKSKEYNEGVLIKSLKTMVYTLRKPPKHFEEFVASHFRMRAYNILVACKAYVDGAQIGSITFDNGVVTTPVDVDNSTAAVKPRIGEFRDNVSRIISLLVTCFIKNGSNDCDEFVTHAVETNVQMFSDCVVPKM